MKRFLTGLGGALLVLLVALGVFLFTPVSDPELTSHPAPAVSYADAAARIEAIAAAEAGMDLQPEGRSIALLSGDRAANAVVIFHGYTTVPEQFRLIGQAYRAQGYNVWIPRLPHHGATDRMTDEFSQLSASELRDFADQSVDIAAGLGEDLTVVGLSGGGSLSLWAGFERPEVAHTYLISPLLHPLGYAEWQDRPLVRALRVLPFDIYNWWSEEKKETNVEGYDYPRFSLKGIAALLSLTHWVDSQNQRPANSTVTLIRNDGDTKLDSAFNERFVTRLVPEERLDVYRIPAEAGLLHDLVANQPHAENYDHLTEAYAYLSEALGIPIPDPKANV